MILKGVIYARVSTEEQATEGYSIAAQKEALQEYAKLRQIDIVDQYVDEGRSGKSIDGRPKMQQLLQAAKDQKFDVVLIYKLDRLSRKTKDSLEIIETLDQHNIQLMSYSENIDTSTPGGKMFYTMLSSFAEMERGTIIDRVKMGMTQRAKQGKWNGGVVFGYDNINKELVINESEAAIVKEIFELASRGHGYKKITGELNHKGYKTKRKKEFSIGTVKGILENPVYIGKIRFNQHVDWSEKRRRGKNANPEIIDGTHAPIISIPLWKEVHHKKKKRSYRPTQSKKPFILTKLLRCPVCGHGMVSGASNGIYRFYQCGQYKAKGATACKAYSINADVAEKQVLDELRLTVEKPYFIDKLVATLNDQRLHAEQPLAEERKRLYSSKAKLEKQMDNIVNQLMDMPELQDVFKKKLLELKKVALNIDEHIQRVEKELKSLDTQPIDAEALRNLLSHFDAIISRASAIEIKQLLSLFIKNIQITKEPISSEHLRQKSRQISKINLLFDFTIESVAGATGEWFNEMVSLDYIQPVDSSLLDLPSNNEKTIREALASLSVLPLFMIRFTLHNPKTPINLLD
ncbi:recombinase family protein [Lysinibacillus sp. FSL K6-1151]|uniref:recombinase family protein n=1 Tax=Lysinibacillus sp. FSL K6-1151 TaxID=2921465 RepID=UPI0031599D90